MRDAATLELVKLLLSFDSPSRERLAHLLVNLGAEKAKSLATLIEENSDAISDVINVLRLRSNVSNKQCTEAVGIVAPDALIDSKKPLLIQEPVFEHFPSLAGEIKQNTLPMKERNFRTFVAGPIQYTSALQAENLRAELESEIDAPCDLRKEYYYLRDGRKRSFVIGTKLLEHLSRVCEKGGQSKRLFLDALGQKIERSEFSPSSKLKSKTIRREIIDFVVSTEVSSLERAAEFSSQVQMSQH